MYENMKRELAERVDEESLRKQLALLEEWLIAFTTETEKTLLNNAANDPFYESFKIWVGQSEEAIKIVDGLADLVQEAKNLTD